MLTKLNQHLVNQSFVFKTVAHGTFACSFLGYSCLNCLEDVASVLLGSVSFGLFCFFIMMV